MPVARQILHAQLVVSVLLVVMLVNTMTNTSKQINVKPVEKVRIDTDQIAQHLSVGGYGTLGLFIVALTLTAVFSAFYFFA